MVQRQPPGSRNGRASPQPEPPACPILSEEPWSGRQAPVRAHVALVVVYHAGNHQLLWPHERRRVLLHKRPTTVYEVDLGVHHTEITADLPSGDNAGSFHASISVEWRVLDPSTVVRHQVTDIREALLPHLLQSARKIARGFGIGQAAEAEDEINRRLGSHSIDSTDPATLHQAMQQAAGEDRLGAEYGLWTRTIVQFTLDDAAVEHNTKMAQLNWAIEEEKAQHKLRVLQEANEQAIMAERITVYRKIIAAGDTDQFAMQLALHPDDISAIAKIIKDEQVTSRRETIDFVHHMVESGVIERWEVSDQAREALQWLKEATARVIHERDQQEAPQSRRGRAEAVAGGDAVQELPEAAGTPAETIVVEPSQAQGPDTGGSA